MGSIVAENRKSLMLFSGRGFPELAEEIGQVLGVAPTRERRDPWAASSPKTARA